MIHTALSYIRMDIINAFFTFVIAIAAIAQVFVFSWQARSLERTIQSSDISSERQLKPYISIDTQSPNPNIHGGVYISCNKKINIIVYLKNCGKTPAYNVRATMTTHVAPFPPTEDYVPPIESTDPIKANSIINPGQGISIFREFVYSNSLPMASIINKTHAIYFVGKIEFDDIFTKSLSDQKRYVEYRLFIQGKPDDSDHNVSKYYTVQFAENGNEAN